MRTTTATPALIPSLLAGMGAERVARLRGIAGDPAAAIAANIAASAVTWCGVDDSGAVVTLGGVLPTDDPDRGYVWQFITDVAAHKRDYIRQGQAMLAPALERFPRLSVLIETSYPAALRHTRRLGFVPIGPLVEVNGHQAHYCEKQSSVRSRQFADGGASSLLRTDD